MTELLLEWVFTSVFLILVVLAVRTALGRRVSAGLRYALWAVVLVRLLVPVQLFHSPLAGTWVVTEKRTEQIVDGVGKSYEPDEEDILDSLGGQDGPSAALTAFPEAPDPPALPDAPEPPAAPDLTKLPGWLGWAWLAGSAAAAFVLLVSNLRFYLRLRRERVPLDEVDLPLRVFVAAGLPSPCLFGLFRPAVYATPEAAADPDMLRHVLAHEFTHYRHGDHIWSLLRCAALAVHWWDPLVWLAVRLSQRDGELACDEGALKRLGDGERAAYGSTLLALVTAKPRPGDLFRCATTMAGDKKSLKERITRIANAPKRVLWAVVAAVLAMALACVCAFGQAEPEKEADPDGLRWPYGVSEMTYVRDAGGFGGDFTVTLNQDGTFSYYAGPLSSYIGMGTWTEEDGAICLADEGLKDSAGIQYYYFTVEDGSLTFRAEGSAAFMYVDVKDGDRFSRKEAAEEVTADLTFSLDESGNVAISGTVNGLTLGENTYWHPAADAEHPITYLAIENPPYIAGDLEAWWGDDSRTSVMVSTAPTANKFSDDDPNTGFWSFTVDLTAGTVTEKGALASTPGRAESETLRFYPATISDEEAVAVGRLAAKLLTAAEDYYKNDLPGSPTDEWEEHRVLMFHYPDLDRDGVPETIATSTIDGGMGERVGVWQGADVGSYEADWWDNAELLWSDEGYNAHAGYNSVFLCTLGGEDYLLRYHPTMYQGSCSYEYQLFTLENGVETVVRENSIDFDIHGPGMYEGFDPKAIDAFMGEINELLSHSVQLINTDADLRDTFAESGRLYDDLWWLDTWEPEFVRDKDASLLNDLLAYREAMMPPIVRPADPESDELILTYRGKETRFRALWQHWDAAGVKDGTLMDLDRDGRNEIGVILPMGGGTGAWEDGLYLFDAETLEQYDTSGLKAAILSCVESTGDEEDYYLAAPGMKRVSVSKSEAQKGNGDAPAAEALKLGDIIEYSFERDGVHCRLGCDASGLGLDYIGYLDITLGFTPGEGFRCVSARYDPVE